MKYTTRNLAAASCAFGLILGAEEYAMADLLGRPLELQDQGSFFVNGIELLVPL